MGSLVALTGIRHGNEDGSVTEFAEGEVVDLPQDVIDNFPPGTVGEAPAAFSGISEELDASKARVAELEALLEQAKKDSKEDPNKPAPVVTPDGQKAPDKSAVDDKAATPTK